MSPQCDKCIIKMLSNGISPTWSLSKNDVKNSNNFLVLGNDNFINQIDFEKIKNLKNITTVGVNRIWHKFLPDILFFIDVEIITELMRAVKTCPEKNKCPNNLLCKCNLRKKIIFTTTDRIKSYHTREYKFMESIGCKFTKCITRNSMTSILHYLYDRFPKATYYLGGVSLKWSNKHHFWEKNSSILNNKDRNWYKPRLEQAYQDIASLKVYRKANLIIIQPDSLLNHVLPHKKLDCFYKQFLF